MSEDSNLPTPPPSPEERPVQPEAESFDGGLDGDSWLLDVGPEPGTEYEEHESVPALPLDWDEGAPSAEWQQGAEAPAAPPAIAEGFEVFEESEAYGEAPYGYEEFGDGGETSFIEPAPRSRPMVEAILPGTLAMLLSFAGIAVWSFLRTPVSFNENVELARSEHEIHFTPDDEVELAKPLQLPSTGPADDRVAGWMELGQTASDLSEPDELGYVSSAADDEASYASVPTGAEGAVVTTVEPVTLEEQETRPEPTPEATTVLEVLGAAEPVAAEPAAPEAMVTVVAVEDPEVAPAVEPGAAEPEAVATLEPMVEPVEVPAEETAAAPVEETPATGSLQEFVRDVAGWGAVAVELAAESDAAALPEGVDPVAELSPSGSDATPETIAPRPFQGPGCVAAPLELMSDGPLEQVAVADAPEAEGESAPGPETGAETEPKTEPGAFTPGWLMALVAPAAPGAEVATVDAPTVAQLSLPEPEVDTVIEEPAVAPEPFDWTEWTWGPEVAMSAVELPEVEEPYEPRVVEIEVLDAVEDEVATLAEPTIEQAALPEESLLAGAPEAEAPFTVVFFTEAPTAEAPVTETPVTEAIGVAALGWPSDWPSPWTSEAPASEWTPEPAQEPMPTQVVEAIEPVEEAVADEVAAAEFTGFEEAPTGQAEVPAPATLAEPMVEVAAIPEEPFDGEDPAATVVSEEPAFEETQLDELASADPVTDGPMPEENAAPEPAAQEPMVEVAAAEPPPVPQMDRDETSVEAPSLTAIGWPSDWPMAWVNEPVQVAEPEAVAAAEIPEGTPGEVDGVESTPEPWTVAEVITEPQATEVTAAPEEAAEPAPAAELLATAEETTTVTEEVGDEVMSGSEEGEAFEVVAPVEETLADVAPEVVDPVTELAAAESAEVTVPAPLAEPDGDVAQAAAPEEAEEPSEVAMVVPTLPEFAPVLLPPSPDLVSDLHADLSGDDRAAERGSAPAGFEVAASIPAAAMEGTVETEFESVSSAGAIAQQEVAVEVVGSLAEEAPTRRRRQLLQRVEDERYWRFKSVPSRKFNDESMVFTPNVGNVRVVLKGGEAFDGRLHSVGQGKIMLDTKMGRMAVDARRADRVDRITDDRSVLRGPATTTSTSGLKRVKVRTDGGVFYGHLVSREGKRVTILMDEGFRITLESDDVTEAADRRSGRLRRVDER